MNRYYLAVDIGASSGRHILGWMENGKMNLREIYRFSNGMEMVDGTLCWNLVGLFEEIKAGMRECKNWVSTRKAWASTPGLWTLYFWTNRDMCWARLPATGTGAPREWI